MQNFRVLAIFAALAAGLALPPLAHSERTRFWRLSSYEEFEKGTAKGVALRSDGRLVLAPRFAQFADPNMAYLWTLRVDARGNLYAAGGSNAKVMRFDEKGTATQVFESSELAAHALAFDARGNLYVGTSPDGKVYRVAPGGQSSEFFDPKAKYIWDLALAPDGTLYVATGDKGELYAVTPDGKGSLYYKSDETHIRSLAIDAKGNLLLGTEPNGRILRVDRSAKPPAKEGERDAFVLYESGKKEVTALLVRSDGSVYAAAVGEKIRPTIVPPAVQPGVAPQPQPPPAQIVQQQAAQLQIVPQPQQQFVPFPSLVGGSEVIRLGPDDAPEELWSSRTDLVYSLGTGATGKLLLGTGNRGVVVQLESNGIFSNLANTPSSQVTGLAQGPGGKIFVCTANPGMIFALGPDYGPEGTFESEVFDAKLFSQWGRLSWWGENGAASGQVSIYVRAGNTSNPERNWSPWTGPYNNARGELMTVPPARFAQWKAVFRASNPPPASDGNSSSAKTDGPEIAWVSLAYLPRNKAPVIDSVILQDPGIRVQGLSGPPSGQQANQPIPLRLPQTGPSIAGRPGGAQPAQQPGQRFEPPPQGFQQKGMQGVVWSAKDENEDELTYTLYYRGEGEQVWKVLRENLEQKFFAWDTTTMADGAYYLRVVASDAKSNPIGEALTAERVSDRFEVDNTPPQVEGLRAELRGAEVRVTFVARDSYSALARAEFSVDAGEWRTVFPTDRTTDAPQEMYEIVLRIVAPAASPASGEVAPGEHTLAVRIYDRFENSSSAKVTFIVPPPRRP